MSGDAADSTDTRHEPDQVEPGKEGPGRGDRRGSPRREVEEKKRGACVLEVSVHA